MLTAKAIPKDIDVLVTIDGAMELTGLAALVGVLWDGPKLSILAWTCSSSMRPGATLVASAIFASAIHALYAKPSIAGRETILTTIFTSSRCRKNS